MRDRLRKLWCSDRPAVILFPLWGVGLLTAIGLWAWLNADRNPSVEASVAFGAGVVAYVLMGATAALAYIAYAQLGPALRGASKAESDRAAELQTLLEDLQGTRSSVHREISPYVVPTNVRPDQPVSTLAEFENAGKGVALRCRISVFRLVDETTPPFRTFRPVTGGDIQVGNGVVIDQGHTLVMSPDGTWGFRTPYQSRVLLTSFDVRKWEWADDAVFVRTLCFDREARRHERWFSVSEGSEVEELRGGNYPLGSIPEPPPNLGEIDGTARSLQTAFNTDDDDPEG